MPKPSPQKEAYWRKLLRQRQESGRSIRQFCSDHALSEASFYSWRREIERRDRQAAGGAGVARAGSRGKKASPPTGAALFIPLQLAGSAPSAIELVHPQGHVLRIPALFDEACLQQVLHLLDRQQEA